MNSDTLLVVAGDRKAFEKWTRDWGVRLKNTAVTMINTKSDTEGWEGKVYYTILPGYGSLKNHADIIQSLEDSPYKKIPSKTIESKLKSVSISRTSIQ